MAKPILFNTEMVRAILGGHKTVTRRVVKFLENRNPQWAGYIPDGAVLYGSNNIPAGKSPYRPDDILYVRETWKKVCATERYYENGEVVSSDECFGYKYRADNLICWDMRSPRDDEFFLSEIIEASRWHPSIHMPREAARIFLRVANVRVERLQEIDEDGIRAEGLTSACVHAGDMEIAAQEFALLWDSTIKPADRDRYGWEANPLVWVIEFERCDRDGNTI